MDECSQNLARQSLTRQTLVTTRDGLPLFPVQSKAGVVTLELVNRLRDETLRIYILDVNLLLA